MSDHSLPFVFACVVACLAVAIAGAPHEVQAQTQVVYVDSSNTAGTQNGDSWSEAYARLQNALADSRANGTSAANTEIWIAEGAYFPYEGGSPGSNRDVSFTLTGNQDGLEIYGGFSGSESTRSARAPEANPTVLSGDIDGDDNTDEDMIPENIGDINGSNSYRVLLLDGRTGDNITSSTVIDGVIVTAGQANGGSATGANGGGLYCDGDGLDNECSPTLRNVVFVFNKSDQEGGAVYGIGNTGGNVSPTIESGLFAGNQAENRGGAIRLEGTSGSTITNTIFYKNGTTLFSNVGGAISVFADGDGNGMSLDIINATFTKNAAAPAASGNGGAIHANGEFETIEIDIRNTILSGNRADQAEEIWLTGGVDTVVDVASSIVEGGDGGPELLENNSSTITYAGSNINAPPRFSRPNSLRGPDGTLPSGDDGLAVLPGSPALDAGDDAALDTTDNGTPDITADVKGTSRVQDGTVDIGAYEGPVEPHVFRVDADAGGSPPAADGLEWGSAFRHLQDALDVATAIDEIWLTEGTYFPDRGKNASPNDDTESFKITGRQNGLEIYGGFQNGDTFSQRDPSAHPTVLSGDIDADNGGADANKTDGVTPRASDIVGSNSNHVLVLDGGNTLGTNITPNITDATVLDGVAVTAGQADGSDPNDDGGGLYCDGGGSGNECSPTIENVRFVGSNADFGGALFASGNGGTSSPSIERTTFADNRADDDGGAIYNDGQNGTSSPQIIDATFTENTTSYSQ